MERKNKSGKMELRLEDQIQADYGKHVCFPLYMNSYEDALRTIFFRILWIEDGKERQWDSFSYGPQERESNIVSFIGARGSGKTTAMMEFSHIINKLNQKEERQWWIERVFTEQSLKEELINRDFFFKVLEPIDASSLEEKEDLFEMVMSAMLHEYRCERERTYAMFPEYGYGQMAGKIRTADADVHTDREILALFDEITTGYYAIKNSRDENFGDSYIPKLTYMSTSMDINKKMKRLIGKLLRIYQGDRGDDSSGFLVIALDDLDLNIRHGYEMLEQLRKYFFQANIIITLSGDYDQLNRICKYHYVKEFSEGRSHVIEECVQEDCRKLALDYILKTLPISARVFMPSLETMTRDVVVGTGEKAIGVKAFVITKIAEVMQNFYDIGGLKIHFAEPRTVRELVNYNQFLVSLWEIDYANWNLGDLTEEQQMTLMNHYDQNHERFNQDILGRLVNRLLDDEQRKLFREWSRQNLERRASDACSIFWQKIREKDIQQEEYDTRAYVYGDLLEGIYRYGRISDRDKQFVKCVLAFLSSEMVREKISSLKNLSEDSRGRSRIRLNKFLGASFGNPWLGEMVPDVEDNHDSLFSFGYSGFGYYLKAEANKLQVRFPACPQEALSDLNVREPKAISKDTMRKKLKEFEKWMSNQSLIPVLECLTMFYDPMDGQQNNLEFDMYMDRDESSVSEAYYVFARGSNVSCRFDIWGFIKKTLNYEENYKKNCQMLAASLSEMLVEFLEREVKENPNNKDKPIGEEVRAALKEAMDEIVAELSIHHRYPWDNREGAAFPFYDLDVSYNIMKRARTELQGHNPGSIPLTECYSYIAKAYREVIDLLGKQKEEYGRKGVGFDYADNFESCPFVRAFLEDDKGLPGDFKTRLGKTIYNTMQPGSLIRVDHPEGAE